MPTSVSHTGCACRSLAARGLDRSGFPEGATGIAFALHTYATGNAPTTSWDSALLVN
ncbi:hypothetical protein OIE63_35075 [Streptomyces sp. NBC_01795]|uniref:hypothetical protein n=1 Tax=unclassified Streptomyces TaxID=2593676 RepID=UPI002DDB0261|nr:MULTISPECIES: hypothetical protein [unclassified Streptomyces]WSA96203.1 hypothetical protein OIE63_35075 [Streptomyces sp. NBC_01795]WSB80617.1 hypothetical protein OHB04_36180 [Streptomyces sp. NBC_01775]